MFAKCIVSRLQERTGKKFHVTKGKTADQTNNKVLALLH